jgi:hypothetical protein
MNVCFKYTLVNKYKCDKDVYLVTTNTLLSLFEVVGLKLFYFRTSLKMIIEFGHLRSVVKEIKI